MVVHQHTVGINVPDMWPHLLNGIVLVRMGLSAFNGDGGPFLIKWTSGALATTAFLAIIVGTCLNVGLEAFKQKMHVLIYSLGALLCISGTCDGVLRARLASDETLARMRSARSLHDPTVAMCIGFVLYQHVHDTQPIAEHFHRLFAEMIVTAGAVQAMTIFVHSLLPQSSEGAAYCRGIYSGAWLLCGFWMIHMALFLYCISEPGEPWVKRGAHHLLFPGAEANDLASVQEKAFSYLAIDLWLVGLTLGGLAWRKPFRYTRVGTAPRATIDEDKALLAAEAGGNA